MICSFVPPYLLQRLAAEDGDHPRQTLRLDEQLRRRRVFAAPADPRTATDAAGVQVVHDAGGREVLPGAVARQVGDPPTGDLAVDEGWDHAGLVLDLFAAQFGRRSVDGLGTVLSVSVHYGYHYDNAFWDGEQLVFGDGDEETFDRFTKPLDVLAHEFTHGVTQHTAALTYSGQSGALNESVSDVFASVTKQRHLGQRADQADWLIGAGLFLPGVSARALRSMTDPGTAYDDPKLGRDPQVASMADYVDSDDDNGGVHINSGIPNRAFALAAVALGGYSWERPGRIWYDALTAGEVGPSTDFAGFAEATASSAARLFPDDPAVAEQVRAAWVTVGVLAGSGAPSGPSTPSVPATPVAQRVSVRRSGGFTGVPRSAELFFDTEPVGPQVRELLTAVDFSSLTATPPAPDRFNYVVEYGPHRLNLSEPDLTPELHRVVRLVLGTAGPDSGDA